ncbi:hypothetical protein MXL46_04445 [Heyndrickxia sporothermodurans]|uniref:hypothetical protein n=1 Tax=Heyndrickxia sporothermodurans TaxID=46224 RepID=UPI0015E6FF93|nr:hypothetical protein [Heyndrickxia sporothermodurans]MEB6548358.1 hypothetical protein [Heyndrickxia sporothermodurans]
MEKADDPQMNGYDAQTKIYESQICFYYPQIEIAPNEMWTMNPQINPTIKARKRTK